MIFLKTFDVNIRNVFTQLVTMVQLQTRFKPANIDGIATTCDSKGNIDH